MEWTQVEGLPSYCQQYTRPMGILGEAILTTASNDQCEITAWVLSINGLTIARYPMPLTFSQVQVLAESRILSEFTRALDGIFNPHDCETDA